MNSRRNFLTGLASGAAATMFAEPILAQSVPSTTATATTSENSVHVSFAHILVKHICKMQANPKHDPFKSGEIIAAYRMHADALQASGFNTKVTAAARAGQATPVTSADMDKHFETLRKLGVNIDEKAKSKVATMITSVSANFTPRVPPLLQHNTVLKMQRSVHGTMIQKRLGSLPSSVKPTMKVRARVHQPVSHYMTAAYHPGSAHLALAGLYDYGDGGDGGDDGWGDGDDGGGDPELGDPGMGSGGGDEDGGDSYSDQYTEALADGTITLPSGAQVQGCTVFFSLVALAGGIGGLAALAGEGVVAVIAGVVVTGGALAILLAVVAALAAYYAVVC